MTRVMRAADPPLRVLGLRVQQPLGRYSAASRRGTTSRASTANRGASDPEAQDRGWRDREAIPRKFSSQHWRRGDNSAGWFSRIRGRSVRVRTTTKVRSPTARAPSPPAFTGAVSSQAHATSASAPSCGPACLLPGFPRSFHERFARLFEFRPRGLSPVVLSPRTALASRRPSALSLREAPRPDPNLSARLLASLAIAGRALRLHHVGDAWARTAVRTSQVPLHASAPCASGSSVSNTGNSTRRSTAKRSSGLRTLLHTGGRYENAE